MTTAAILVVVVGLALYGLLALTLAFANHYQRRNGRKPFDLDRADGLCRCTRPNCTIDHEAFWGKR